jgi:hypothetical protein
LLKRSVYLIGALCLAFMAASTAQAGSASATLQAGAAKATGCSGSEYSYAGIQSNSTAHGVAATLVPVQAPSVIDGHVGGWVGVGGTDAGPGGVAEWLQVGVAAFSGSDATRSRMYYEVTRPGVDPKYVELDPSVSPGAQHRVAVLEMAKRHSWWRVWVDGTAVSPAMHLPGSHGTWYPQAIGENWNGGTGACNAFNYRFKDVMLAQTGGGSWKPLGDSYVFQDSRYKVVRTAATPSSFTAISI